jgi:hypothetical protein
MITKWLKNRAQRKLDEKLRLATKQHEIEENLRNLGPVLKDVLVNMGIEPFPRMNRNFEDQYITCYGILHDRLVCAELTLKGAFIIKYV